MSARVHLASSPSRPWHWNGQAAARGFVRTADGERLEGAALAAHLDAADDLPAALATLSGEFAWVRAEPGREAAAVDAIRSLPLFYGRDAEGRLCLSDDVRWVAAAVDARLDDPAAVAEFMLQGLTTGPTTLASAVRQVQAGEVVSWDGGAASARRHFRYGLGEPLEGDEEALAEAAVAHLERAFGRLLEEVRGRPVVVPLSGGMDSRMIAAMLAAGGRTDALCFTYGRRGFEWRASRRVARALGLRWAAVPYSSRGWSRWARTEAFQRYRRFAGGLAAIEHEQDWPAVRALLRRGYLPPDAVVVPGHAGDFLGGSHLPPLPDPIEGDPVAWIWRRYYDEWPTDALTPGITEELHARIAERVAGAEGVGAFTTFGWQERQAKVIAAAVRVYEFHGLDWRLPFWNDAGLLDFWGCVPIELRRGRRLYRRVFRRLLGPTSDLPSTLTHPEPRWVGRYHRLVGRYGGYGMWLGPHPLARGLHVRLHSLTRIEHPVVGPVVRQLAAPVARRPPQAVRVNGLLALAQLRDLVREVG